MFFQLPLRLDHLCLVIDIESRHRPVHTVHYGADRRRGPVAHSVRSLSVQILLAPTAISVLGQVREQLGMEILLLRWRVFEAYIWIRLAEICM